MSTPSTASPHGNDLLPLPPDQDDAQPAALPRPRLHRRRFLRDVLEAVLLFVVIYSLVNLLTARFVVEGSSMTPNFATGQYVIVSRLSYMLGDPQRGDVVVFHSPENGERDLIKRVIGLPGEHIRVEGGVVYINDVPYSEPYINAQPRYQDDVTLEPDEYYLLGDNRNNSRDSHNFGPVPRGNLIGQAWFIYWPLDDFGLIEHNARSDRIQVAPPPTLIPTPTLIPVE